MPVLQVDDGPTLRPDCVYVIPPDRELVIEGDSVTARPFTEPRGRRAPIDLFFRSIAAARGDGIAVVLSGAGADGAVGVRAVKEAGGVVMVQEPAEAGFGSMPQNAIATGVADFVAPVARLAERLGEVARSKEAVRSLDMDGAPTTCAASWPSCAPARATTSPPTSAPPCCAACCGACRCAASTRWRPTPTTS